MGGRSRGSVLWSVLLAMVVVMATAAHAWGSAFSLSTTTFEAVFKPLTMTGVSGGSTFVVRCDVTLEGSFEGNTFAIDRGPIEVGIVTRATMSGCTEGVRVRFLTETLPWPITFASYRGTLPNITSIDYELRGLRVLIEAPPFMACLFRSTQATPATYRWELQEGLVVSERFVEERTVERLSTLFRESFLICPGALELAGRKEPSPLTFNLI